MRLRKEPAELPEKEVILVAEVSDALAHPARVKIYKYIMECNKHLQSVCNGDVVKKFDLSQATVSQHIKRLLNSGLVELKRKDRYSYYYANIGMLARFLDAVKKL